MRPCEFWIAFADYDPGDRDFGPKYLHLRVGDIILKYRLDEEGWWFGERVDLCNLSVKLDEGWYPLAYTVRYEVLSLDECSASGAIANAWEVARRTVQLKRRALERREFDLEQDRQAITRKLQAASADLYSLPSYWCIDSLDEASVTRHGMECLVEHIQGVLQATSCRRCRGNLTRPPTLNIERVENTLLWKLYGSKCRDIRERHQFNDRVIDPLNPAVCLPMDVQHEKMCKLESAINETYLLHGVKGGSAVADIIIREGFDVRVANLKGLYGAGIYFAEQACKALQYAEPDGQGLRYMFYCRVALGRAFATKGTMQDQRRPPPGYDSIVSNSRVANQGHQVHQEFVVYDGS